MIPGIFDINDPRIQAMQKFLLESISLQKSQLVPALSSVFYFYEAFPHFYLSRVDDEF
jgi:hypothetical protein